MRRWFLTVLLCAVAIWPAAFAEEPDLGKILVASPALTDPNFANAVVLIIHYGEDGTLGLIINRASSVNLAKLFPELKLKRNASDFTYTGGPLEQTAQFTLVKSNTRPEAALPLLRGVYLLTNAEAIRKAVASGQDSGSLRLLYGYCGWAPGQLENEIEAEAWTLLPGRDKTVFDSEPSTLWDRLSQRAKLQIAQLSSFR